MDNKMLEEIREWYDGKKTLLPTNIRDVIGLLLEKNDNLKRELDAKLVFISKGNDEHMYWLQEENIRLETALQEALEAISHGGDGFQIIVDALAKGTL